MKREAGGTARQELTYIRSKRSAAGSVLSYKTAHYFGGILCPGTALVAASAAVFLFS